MTEATDDIVQQATRRVWGATGLFVGAVAFASLFPQNDRAIWDIPRITSAFAATPFADERYAVEPITLAYGVIDRAGRPGGVGGIGGPRDVNRSRLTPLRQIASTVPGASDPTAAGTPETALPTLGDGGNGVTTPTLADLVPTATPGGGTSSLPGGFFPGFGGGPGTTADVDPTDPTTPTTPTNPTTPTDPTTPTTPGVPEPSVWILLISGFAIVGTGLRRARRAGAIQA